MSAAWKLMLAGLAVSSALAQPAFVDVTDTVGINVVQEGLTEAGTVTEQQFQRAMGNGVAVGDYDNDGDLDLYFVRGNGRPVLLRNNLTPEGRRFRDVTVAAGVDKTGNLRVAHFADFDNDGWLDLLAVGDDDNEGPNGTKIYRNNGDGTFSNRTPNGNLRPLGQLHCGASVADYDGDGLLDIYVTNWSLHGVRGPSQFEGSNRLYRNLGDFVFEDVTGPSGLGTVARDSFTAIFTDFNDDLRPDLFIAQDHLEDKFYFNTAGGFIDASFEVGSTHRGNDMGLAAADFDDDGDLDVFASNITDAAGVFGSEQFNSFNVNIGTPSDPQFEDQATERGVQDTYWGWGAEFTDVELDGDLDLVVGTGFDEFVETLDPESGILESPTVLFVNNGSGQFSRRNGTGLDAGWDTRGVVAFDYDRDGDEDLLLTNIRQPARLLENVGADGNWLSVRLRQLPGRNRQGIGARVYATVGTRTMRRDILAGRSYVVGNPDEAHFGLGTIEQVDALRVEWTDGSETTLQNVPVNQLLLVDQRGQCDCDDDGQPDGDQLRAAPQLDADENGVLDSCQVDGWDCNGNDVPDSCEPDCNADGIPDDCQLQALTDCDGDAILDSCNLADGGADCNGNGILDRCEIASGAVADSDDNGIPDSCELLAGCPSDTLFGALDSSFGEALAYSDDLLVVGASDPAPGQVLVYRRTGSSWTLEDTLTAPDVMPGDRFGRSVATDGLQILVGADFQQVDEQIRAGAAYIFTQTESGWGLHQRLTAPDGAGYDWFGRSVAIHDDCAVLGAPGASRGIANSGTAYVFQRDPSGFWHEARQIFNAEPQRDDNFGTSVALFGKTLAIGGHKLDLGWDLADAGGVHVYQRLGTVWVFQAHLQAPFPAASDRFGWSLALHNNLLIVGADRRDRGADNAGVAYAYRGIEGNWMLEGTLHAPRPQTDAGFGGSVAVWNDRVAVGAARARGAAGPGATYMFGFDGHTWGPRAKWTGLDGASGDAVAIGERFLLSSAADSASLLVLTAGHSDCNANGITDACDLADGTLSDADDDGAADECCYGDFDADGVIGLSDLAMLLAGFAQPVGPDGAGDLDGDRDVDLHDLMQLLVRFGSTCE